jgi:hypothetical protein
MSHPSDVIFVLAGPVIIAAVFGAAAYGGFQNLISADKKAPEDLKPLCTITETIAGRELAPNTKLQADKNGVCIAVPAPK